MATEFSGTVTWKIFVRIKHYWDYIPSVFCEQQILFFFLWFTGRIVNLKSPFAQLLGNIVINTL